MKCARCMQRGEPKPAPDMKVFENSTDVFMKCPRCNWAKGVKKNPKNRR